MIEVKKNNVSWPKPPACVTSIQLKNPPNGTIISVAGLVLVRQRPGTAKGVIFITLEDETGTTNIIVWKKIFNKYRRTIIESRLLKVTGRLQREGDICHIIAEHVEDISYMLDEILN